MTDANDTAVASAVSIHEVAGAADEVLTPQNEAPLAI